MPSAYEISCSGDDGYGMYYVYMLISAGLRTPVRGMPARKYIML